MDYKEVLNEILDDLNNNHKELIYQKTKTFSSKSVEVYGKKRHGLMIECLRWNTNENITEKNWEDALKNDKLIKTEFYKNGKYRVVCKKPGKKKWSVNSRSKLKLRKNDFRPELEIKGRNKPLIPDFAEFWSPFFIEKNKSIGWILFLVFFRLAFMLDHELVQGKWRLDFKKLPATKKFLDSQEIYLKLKTNEELKIPAMVYLNFIETVLMAEDSYVFVNSKEWFDSDLAMAAYVPEYKNKESAKNTWDHGRVNTALTFCNVSKSSVVGDGISGVPDLLQMFVMTRGMGQIKRGVFVEKITDLNENRRK